MEFSRRSALSMIPAATLWALSQTLRAEAAPAASQESTGSSDRVPDALLTNTVAVFAGTAESNARPEVAPKLASLRATAQARLAAMDGAGPDELFEGVPLGTSDPNLSTSYQYLYEIALATCLPGTGASDPA